MQPLVKEYTRGCILKPQSYPTTALCMQADHKTGVTGSVVTANASLLLALNVFRWTMTTHFLSALSESNP